MRKTRRSSVLTAAFCLCLALLLVLPTASGIAADAEQVTFTVDGQEVRGIAGDLYRLPDDLVYAEYVSGVREEFLTGRTVKIEAGMEITTHTLAFATSGSGSVRLGTPTGLRFETYLERAGLEALLADENVSDVSIGTLIAPTAYFKASGVSTIEDGTLAGTPLADRLDVCLDVPATVGEWYRETKSSCYFAGSVANVKEEHYNTLFSGVGYIKIELADRTKVTIYSVFDAERDFATLAGKAYQAFKSGKVKRDTLLGDLLAPYADARELSEAEAAEEALKGLNVLAIGDSLFGGHTLGTEGQWLTLIGKQYGWNLTNLGSNGWTVAYNPELSTRASLYNRVVTVGDYVFRGDAAAVDYVFLEGGFNDYGMKIPVGSTADRTEDTFCGAWILLTEHLLTEYPNAKVIFVTPWEIEGNSVAYTGQINVIYEELYENNDRVLLLDAGNPLVSGINMNKTEYKGVSSTLSQYSIWRDTYWDPYHLREEGMAQMKTVMTPLIQAMVRGRDYHEAFDGLNVLAIGDSLFAGDSTGKDKQWITLLAKEYGWNYTNVAQNGWALFYGSEAATAWDSTDKLKGASISYQLTHNAQTYRFGSSSWYNLGAPSGDPEDVDLIFIEAGTNDYSHFSNAWRAAAPLGTVEDTTPETFLGAMNYTLRLLETRYPNATIVLVTPWHLENRVDGTNRHGQTLDGSTVDSMTAAQFTRSLLTLYRENYADDDSVLLLDAGDPLVSGINMNDANFRSAYSQSGNDSFHLNERGHRLMRDAMRTYLYDIVMR